MSEPTDFEGWAILEIMGHRKLGGYVRPATVAGAAMLRVDVPEPTATDATGPWAATQYYSPTALFCLTPVTADVAIRFAATCRPEPVARWEMPALPAVATARPRPGGGDDDDFEATDDDRPF